MTDELSEDRRVARRLLGHFIDGDYKEIVQLEYRYDPCKEDREWNLFTRIRGQEYYLTAYKFFGALAELLDQLPVTSAIVIPHREVILNRGTEEIATLEEWLSPYEIRPAGGIVVYQLKLLVGERSFETPKRSKNGYLVSDFGRAADLLRASLGSEIQLRICYFCRYLVEYEDGGTDDRHDMYFCFRDVFPGKPEKVDELLANYPAWRSRGSWVKQGMADVDALHSCAAFTYREKRRP